MMLPNIIWEMLFLYSKDMMKQLYTQGHRLKPNAIKYKGLGTTFIDNKRYNDAIEQFKKVLEYEPKDTYAHFQYGFALNNLKRYEEAVEQFQIVLKN